ncbi:MAG: alpha-glucan family phosphorylase [Acidimicrobiales bacterium]
MKALRSFTVRPRMPEALAPLHELAVNLRWAWDEGARAVFGAVDADAWEASGHDPLAMLRMVGQDRLDGLASDPGFLALLRAAHDDLGHHLDADLWFQEGDYRLQGVAYFSPEFGIAESLPQYSGGLGVLAGDHLKAASGLGVPLVGVGLLYRQGYFRQELAADGWQEQRYVSQDPHALALTPCEGDPVTVDQAGRPLLARIWQAQVGRIRLLLLDTHVAGNDDDSQAVTDRLYGGDTEHRLRQEILLGVGGVRALEQRGITPQVFHTNEGHAGFLGLERIRRHIRDDGLTFAEAIEAVRSGTIFTTHTPVPAGIERFNRSLMERYFGSWADEFGVSFDTLMALGQEPGQPADAPFNMAVMGLRLAGFANGVSRLHGQVSRRIFAGLWPGVPEDEVPIGSVTNGVHARSWVSPEMSSLFARHVGDDWAEGGAGAWEGIYSVDNGDLWTARGRGRHRLVEFSRRRLRSSLLAHQAAGGDVDWADQVLDPDALTIGFARRFATYKRATLLLSQPERLSALLLAADRPVQLLFAGKAHPADELGKDMIRQVVQFSRQPHVRHRVVFLEDYDIAVARLLYQGCDLWLNTPRRPLEACGTSGEKAALNGALNCSVSDGWWDECHDGSNGWIISSAEHDSDLERRDRAEAASLFDLLEHQIVPAFYDRDGDGRPGRWLSMVRSSLRSLGPFVVASRMLRDYVTDMYEPAAGRRLAMEGDGHARARALAAWKAKVRAAWDGVVVEHVDADDAPAQTGEVRNVTLTAALGGLSPTDVEVQLLHGPVAPTGEIIGASIAPMKARGAVDGNGRLRFEASFACTRAGGYGWTVRVVPDHPDLITFSEVGVVTTP